MTRSRPASIFAPMSARVLAMFLVLAGCGSAGAGGGGGDPVTWIEAASIDAQQAQVLGILTSGAGDLLVRGEETDSLTIQYVASAGTINERFENPVETIDKEDSVFVTVRPGTDVSIDLNLIAPEKMIVGLRDEGRNVIFRNVENRVDVFLHTGGSLDLEDIEGPLTIADRAGRGPIVIRDDGGGITIDDVKNSVKIETGDGDVAVVNAGANVELVMGAGRLVLREIAGNVTYRKTGGGEVIVEGVTGSVQRR